MSTTDEEMEGMYVDVFLTLLEAINIANTEEQKAFLVKFLQVSRLVPTGTTADETGFSSYFSQRNQELLGSIENKETRWKQIVSEWFSEFDEAAETLDTLNLEAAKLKAAELEVAKLEVAKLEAAKLEVAKLEAARERIRFGSYFAQQARLLRDAIPNFEVRRETIVRGWKSLSQNEKEAYAHPLVV
jgi:hypothetical protein